MRLAFAGTPEFAQFALASLHAAGHEIALVLTQPDRPAGRGMKPRASPVKAFALAHRIPVAQPESLRLDGRFAAGAAAARAALQVLQPELMVVAAFGLILPAWTLALPRLGCLNIHASLLPRWRGAAPIQRAIEAGDSQTGVTIMQMDAGLDTGDMLLVEALDIEDQDTSASLQQRLAALGARLVTQALGLATRGALERVPQASAGATYAHKIGRAEAAIRWADPAQAIERRMRAFDPFPGASSMLNGEVVKCWRAELAEGAGAPGTVLVCGEAGITVACGEGALRLTELQRPGGRRATARQFLQAMALRPGMAFEPAAI